MGVADIAEEGSAGSQEGSKVTEEFRSDNIGDRDESADVRDSFRGCGNNG